MKTFYIVSIDLLKVHNPTSEYLQMILDTFKTLYTKPNDEMHIVDHTNSYGGLLRLAAENPDVTEVVIAPADLAETHAIQSMRNHAQQFEITMIANIVHPATATDYYSIGPGLVYLDMQRLRTMDGIDWGSKIESVSGPLGIHLNYPASEDEFYSWGSSALADNLTLDAGWIMFSRLIGANLKMSAPPPDVQGRRVVYYDDLVLRITDIDNANITSEQREYFKVTQAAMFDKWRIENSNLSFTATSKFTEVGYAVENFYLPSQSLVHALAFFRTLNKNQSTRLIFIHSGDTEEELCKNILSNWNGTNTSDITNDSTLATQLDSFYSAFASEEFNAFWSYCNSIYHAHYTYSMSELGFIEDLESQCHVNNVIWTGSLGNHPVMLKASKLTLASSEFVYVFNDVPAIAKVGFTYYKADLYKKFRMTLRNTLNGQQQSIQWQLKDNLIAQKWARANHYDYLVAECIAEKNYMLQHWEYQADNPNARSIPALCAELNRYVAIINEYFDGSSDRRVNYHITQYFDPATLDQNILNEIHHHFEVLIGQVWNVSEYFKKADFKTNFAIRQLNNLCHEMESLRKPGIEHNALYWSAYIYFPFIPGKRYKFVESDYDNFIRTKNFGDLLLHYAQLGKTPLEAWNGRDEVVFDENITGLRYLSGEFVITFGADLSKEFQLERHTKDDEAFFPWLRGRGQDPESKFTGVGNICIGDLIRSDFPGQTANEIMKDLFKYDDIYKLELLDENDQVIAEKLLDYTWKDVLNKTDPTRMQSGI
jgi:hypothetical protein